NSKNYDVAIHIKGWAEMTGWFTCMGITQTSLLSTKTRIEPLDTKVALDKIVSANVNTYQFKTDVAKGKTKRHASVIIDDVHDGAEYCTPEEFISEDGKGRDDGDIIGYLMGAVQELTKRIKTLEEKTK
ncbi:tail fiber domain-containing protein, partial [Vibrio vulnificus]|uniref:tail fiber domain-containing protein n=1 Tax=Vibrio vulnificus TaxID=672 RepID=UPI0039B54902